jgi:serine/threonine-protein phosphatase 2A regulatory subunit A
VQVLAESLTEELLTNEALPLALQLAKDPVANIRFTLARTLEVMAPRVSLMRFRGESLCTRDGSHLNVVEPQVDHAVVEGQVRPCLEELASDKDKDVRYFAKRAAKTCDGLTR